MNYIYIYKKAQWNLRWRLGFLFIYLFLEIIAFKNK